MYLNIRSTFHLGCPNTYALWGSPISCIIFNPQLYYLLIKRTLLDNNINIIHVEYPELYRVQCGKHPLSTMAARCSFWTGFFVVFGTVALHAVAKPPHIIFIVADDLGKLYILQGLRQRERERERFVHVCICLTVC